MEQNSRSEALPTWGIEQNSCSDTFPTRGMEQNSRSDALPTWGIEQNSCSDVFLIWAMEQNDCCSPLGKKKPQDFRPTALSLTLTDQNTHILTKRCEALIVLLYKRTR